MAGPWGVQRVDALAGSSGHATAARWVAPWVGATDARWVALSVDATAGSSVAGTVGPWVAASVAASVALRARTKGEEEVREKRRWRRMGFFV
jgi:hypothetical protein